MSIHERNPAAIIGGCLRSTSPIASGGMVEDWHPIVSGAEQEGATVLLGWENGEFEPCFGFWSGDYHGLHAYCDEHYENGFIIQPTHWKPRPAGPASSKESMTRPTADEVVLRVRVAQLEAFLRTMNCPRPCNQRPDDFTVGECTDAGECGCDALRRNAA